MYESACWGLEKRVKLLIFWLSQVVFKLKLKYKVDKVGEKHDWWVLSFRIISLVYSRKTQEKPKRKPQEKSKGISLILKALQYADYHNSFVYLFYLTREFSVIFP